jgi:chromosomal replication initiation ATPase DnaA
MTPDLSTRLTELRRRRDLLAELLKVAAEIQTMEAKLLLGPSSVTNTIRLIAETVADRFGVTVPDLQSHRRPERLVKPRQILYHLARFCTGRTYAEIGQILGRNHGTILYGCERVRDDRSVDPRLDREIAELELLCAKQIDGASAGKHPDPASPERSIRGAVPLNGSHR